MQTRSSGPLLPASAGRNKAEVLRPILVCLRVRVGLFGRAGLRKPPNDENDDDRVGHATDKHRPHQPREHREHLLGEVCLGIA